MAETFELRITWRMVFLLIGSGMTIIFTTLSIVVWFLFPFLTEQNLENGFSSLAMLGVSLITGAIFAIPFFLYFGIILTYEGIRDIGLMIHDNGILYKMDYSGITYQENWRSIKKEWVDIVDVGLFKQESSKNKILYEYQIKFSDGSSHTFDLRGSYPTKEFNSKVEEYWLKYIYQDD